MMKREHFKPKVGTYTPEQGLKLLGLDKFLKTVPFPIKPYKSCYAAYIKLVKQFKVSAFGQNQVTRFMIFDTKTGSITLEANNVRQVSLSRLLIATAFCHEVTHMDDFKKHRNRGLVIDEARGYATSMFMMQWLYHKFGLPTKQSHKDVWQRIYQNDGEQFVTALALMGVFPKKPIAFIFDQNKLKNYDALSILQVYPRMISGNQFARPIASIRLYQLIYQILAPYMRRFRGGNKCHTWKEIFPQKYLYTRSGTWRRADYIKKLGLYLSVFQMSLPQCVSLNTFTNWNVVLKTQADINAKTNKPKLWATIRKNVPLLFKKLFGISYRKYFKR